MIEQLCEYLQVRQNFTISYRPETNGLVERSGEEAMRHVRAIIFDKRNYNKWSMYLPLIERIINVTYNSTIGMAPVQLLFGNMINLDRNILDIEDRENNDLRGKVSTY